MLQLSPKAHDFAATSCGFEKRCNNSIAIASSWGMTLLGCSGVSGVLSTLRQRVRNVSELLALRTSLHCHWMSYHQEILATSWPATPESFPNGLWAELVAEAVADDVRLELRSGAGAGGSTDVVMPGHVRILSETREKVILWLSLIDRATPYTDKLSAASIELGCIRLSGLSGHQVSIKSASSQHQVSIQSASSQHQVSINPSPSQHQVSLKSAPNSEVCGGCPRLSGYGVAL